ncbi:calexcitin-2-like [Pectinophora gossypiella]|uniref:calexcitin-2-like n=1 Tax=Pectinophora gossypiella TaxID=13191 RepID=UPI00214E028A|nr:calexcitin-2-like [Pectinophora gossypiella]
MVSDFRKKKYMHVFNKFFDTNKDGTVDKKDFSEANANLAKLRGYAPGDVTYELMKELLTNLWDGLVKQADTDGDGVINAEEWVKLWDEYAKNPSAAAEWQQLYCKCVFQLEDASNDGAIDANEYANVYESFGLDKNQSLEAFKKMAKGKDTINWEEFQELWKQYFASDNPDDAGNFIFGII